MFLTTFLCVAGTLLVYQCVLRLYLRYRHPLINVVGRDYRRTAALRSALQHV